MSNVEKRPFRQLIVENHVFGQKWENGPEIFVALIFKSANTIVTVSAKMSKICRKFQF
jgi:hypothetical protein